METPPNTLEDISRLAAAGYNPKQVAYILGIAPAEFDLVMQDESHPAHIAYFKGFYGSELAVRESIMEMARSASSPAQTLAVKIFTDTRNTLLKNGTSETI